MENVKYLNYEEKKSNRKAVRDVAAQILNVYLKTDLSINKLRKKKALQLKWNDSGKIVISEFISLSIFEKHINENEKFDFKKFKLPEIKDNWLDGSFEVGLPQHIVGNGGGSVKMRLQLPFGENFPIKPLLDREGVMYNSFQGALLKKIINLHKKLVENSNDFLNPDWLFDLITLISCSISIVDITLNQFYTKAEYDPFKDWDFDKNILGRKENRRLVDKLLWVKQITGNNLDDIHHEMKVFKELKEIRNHTQHFDPPCFGFTLEEVTIWLNNIPIIASLLLKIRKRINSGLNQEIIELMILRKDEFTGVTLFGRDREVHEGIGYETAKWPAKSQNNDM